MARWDGVTLEDRFWSKVKKLPSGHWIWVGATSGHGRYGMIHYNGRNHGAHRVAWELLVGPVPSGLVIDHICRVGLCVNPAHMQATTQRVNVLRGDAPAATNAAKTHCKRGHEFTPENTKIIAGGRRLCITCKSHPEVVELDRAGQRRRYWKAKQAAVA